MTYKTIHTIHGLQLMAAAEAKGIPINLTHMAVGDGNGNPVTPKENQTQLVRERFRGKVNRVFPDPKQPNKYSAEIVIPATEGGFVMREIAAFDASGGMFVVGDLPASYKAQVNDGLVDDTVLRIDFLVTNAGVVTIILDPNVAVVTQSWISNNVTAGTLLPGGTTGQVARKKSNADGDIEWGDPSEVNVLVSTVEEQQTLAEGQRQVDLALTTTMGLALYVQGERLPKIAGADGWEPDEQDKTRLTLGKSYPAGTRLTAVQNEPASHMEKPLQQALNLADVLDKAAGRAALDVYSKAESDRRTPVSAVMYFPRTTAPEGWLKANGAAVSRTAYAQLYAIIGTSFGAGDGFNTFNLPDLRGEFVRGFDDGRGIDLNRGIGTLQGDQLGRHGHGASSDSQGAHTHSGSTDTQGEHSHGGSTSSVGDHQHDSGWGEAYGTGPYGAARSRVLGSADSDYDNYSYLTSPAGGHNHTLQTDAQGRHRHGLEIAAGGAHAHNITVNTTGGDETRPRNVALLACIKY